MSEGQRIRRRNGERNVVCRVDDEWRTETDMPIPIIGGKNDIVADVQNAHHAGPDTVGEAVGNRRLATDWGAEVHLEVRRIGRAVGVRGRTRPGERVVGGGISAIIYGPGGAAVRGPTISIRRGVAEAEVHHKVGGAVVIERRSKREEKPAGRAERQVRLQHRRPTVRLPGIRRVARQRRVPHSDGPVVERHAVVVGDVQGNRGDLARSSQFVGQVNDLRPRIRVKVEWKGIIRRRRTDGSGVDRSFAGAKGGLAVVIRRHIASSIPRDKRGDKWVPKELRRTERSPSQREDVVGEAVIVEDGPGGAGARQRHISRRTQVKRKGLVGLDANIAENRNADKRGGHTSVEGQVSRRRKVICAGDGSAVGGAVIYGDRLVRGLREHHVETHRSAAYVPFFDRNVVDSRERIH